MKKTIFIAGCLILGVVSVYQKSQTQSPVDEFLLMNVEALATSEYNDNLWYCKGIGETECPDIYMPNYYSLRK